MISRMSPLRSSCPCRSELLVIGLPRPCSWAFLNQNGVQARWPIPRCRNSATHDRGAGGIRLSVAVFHLMTPLFQGLAVSGCRLGHHGHCTTNWDIRWPVAYASTCPSPGSPTPPRPVGTDWHASVLRLLFQPENIIGPCTSASRRPPALHILRSGGVFVCRSFVSDVLPGLPMARAYDQNLMPMRAQEEPDHHHHDDHSNHEVAMGGDGTRAAVANTIPFGGDRFHVHPAHAVWRLWSDVIFVDGSKRTAMPQLARMFHGPVAMAVHALRTGNVLAGSGGCWAVLLHGPSSIRRCRRDHDVFSPSTPCSRTNYHMDWINEHHCSRYAPAGVWFCGRVVTRGLIDGAIVNGSWKLVARISAAVRRVQSGFLYHYAPFMILGVFAS